MNPMNVQAEVSLYPLRTREIGNAIAQFAECLRRPDLDLDVGAMSSRISGKPEDVFDALRDAFMRVAADHQVVLTIKASNACPENGAPEDNGKRLSGDGR